MALQEEVKAGNNSQTCLVRTIFEEHSLEGVCSAGQALGPLITEEPTHQKLCTSSLDVDNPHSRESAQRLRDL